ncbi:hypothetical protein BGX26_008539 [Mortierella sp. AD094]|nr:hypothetical protein BGX26_008539 [Mortierella sp. AD094]
MNSIIAKQHSIEEKHIAIFANNQSSLPNFHDKTAAIIALQEFNKINEMIKEINMEFECLEYIRVMPYFYVGLIPNAFERLHGMGVRDFEIFDVRDPERQAIFSNMNSAH